MPFSLFRKTKKRPRKSAKARPASDKMRRAGLFHKPESPGALPPVHDEKLRLKAALAAAGAALVLLLVGRYASLDFTLVIAALMGLCGLIAYDMTARRRWEEQVADRIEKLSGHHDRLVREVARNRNDIAALKDGFADIAATVKAKGARMPPATSIEGRMLETMVEHLEKLGDRPRAPLEQSANDEQILALEMAPPPAKAPPISALDAALNDNRAEYSDGVVVDLLHHAVQNDRIDAFLQPVVSLPQRRICMYEIYGRLRAQGGTHLPAARYMNLARSESLTPALDNMLLLRCLRMLGDKRSNLENATYILNICGGALSDSGFMNDLVAFLARNRALAKNLIFELPQAELEDAGEDLQPLLDGLSRLGCRFSVDQVRRRQISVAALKSRHIRFIKLDAAWLLQEAQMRGGVPRIHRLKKQLAAAGIDMIVEKIENEGMLRELLDFNIDYGQGWLLGKPDHIHAYRHLKKTA